MTLTVYSKPACPACNATYRELDKKGLKEGVDYKSVDMSEDPSALEYVRSLGYQQAPVLVAGDDHWSGFKKEKIAALFAAKEAA